MVEKITFRGHRFNQRTIDMIQEAELNLRNLLGSGFGGFDITQGSFTSAVTESARTHQGAGAVDISAKGLSTAQRNAVVFELRRVGFAAWFRKKGGSFKSDHFHAIAVRDPDLSTGDASAFNQVLDYFAGKNGLITHAKDPGPRDFVGRTFEQYKQKRGIKDVTETAPEPAKTADVHIRVRATRMAATGKPISDTFAFDADKFMAFAAARDKKVVTKAVLDKWHKTHDQASFVKAVKAVQQGLNLAVDGDPGPVTLARMEHFGYFTTP